MKPAAPDLAGQLAGLPLFGGLPVASLALLASATQERHYARGEEVFQKGERPSGLCVVLSGKLKEACRGPGGEEKILEVLGSGETCGEAALFLGTPHPFPVTALSNSVLLHVEKTAIDALINSRPLFVNLLLQVLASKQHRALRDIEAYALSSPLQRVVGYLIDQCHEGGEGTPSLLLPAPKQVIASRLGMTPAALSRTFRDLSEAGLISLRGKRVVLCDPARLKGFAR
jgi:CRP-like cAMP-binding protein